MFSDVLFFPFGDTETGCFIVRFRGAICHPQATWNPSLAADWALFFFVPDVRGHQGHKGVGRINLDQLSRLLGNNVSQKNHVSNT